MSRFNPHWGSSNKAKVVLGFYCLCVSIPIGVLRMNKTQSPPPVFHCRVSIPIGVLRMHIYLLELDIFVSSFNPHWGSSNRADIEYCASCYRKFQSPLGFFELSRGDPMQCYHRVSIPIGVLRIITEAYFTPLLFTFQSPLGFFESIASYICCTEILFQSPLGFFEFQRAFIATHINFGFNPHWGSSNCSYSAQNGIGKPFQSPLGFFESYSQTYLHPLDRFQSPLGFFEFRLITSLVR